MELLLNRRGSFRIWLQQNELLVCFPKLDNGHRVFQMWQQIVDLNLRWEEPVEKVTSLRIDNRRVPFVVPFGRLYPVKEGFAVNARPTE
jgi:hypothetical protein